MLLKRLTFYEPRLRKGLIAMSIRRCFQCYSVHENAGPLCPDCFRTEKILNQQKKVLDKTSSYAPSSVVVERVVDRDYDLDSRVERLSSFVDERVNAYNALFMKLEKPLKTFRDEISDLKKLVEEIKVATIKGFAERDQIIRELHSEIQKSKKSP
jgi:hypothetical protein